VTDLPPGPRLPGPLQTLRYTFDQPRFFAQQRARYGQSWTLRLPGFPPAVVTTDRDAIKRLFTGDPLTKRHGNDLLAPILGERSLLLLEPAEHLARRKIELPPFHGEAIRAYQTRVRELADAEVAGWSGGVRTHERARDLTLAIILELVLGIRDAGLRSELHRLFDSFGSANDLALFLPDWVSRRSRWNLPARSAYGRLDRIRALLAEHIQRVRAAPGDDVLSLLVGELDDEALNDELMTLVAAGHDTTATAIAWACDLLAHHPHVATRLREGDPAYLKATAKEVLRVRTVAYISAGRYPLEPFPVGEWVVHPGTAILVDAQGVHGDPDVHADPEAFRPERFLDGQPDSYGYLPFGGGAHRCLGAALATLELETTIAAIADTVELAPTGDPAKPVRRGITLAPGNAGKVDVRLRRRPAAPLAVA
jgi:cytochrome P450